MPLSVNTKVMNREMMMEERERRRDKPHPSLERKYTLGKEFYTSDKDQFSRFKRLDTEEKEAVEIALEEFDKDIALFASENEKKKIPTGNDDGSVEWVVNQEGRVIVKFYYNTGEEIFHISSFIKKGRIGGIHIAWPCPKNEKFHDCHDKYSNARNGKRYIYLTLEWIMKWLGEGHKINGGVDLLNTILEPLITYFETGRSVSDQSIEISGNIAEFIKSCKNYHYDLKHHGGVYPVNKIINLLKAVHEETTQYITWGGSTKTVMYLVKIDKLKQKNKLLKKDKIKNKNKIEKNNKLINELKAKAKKEKAKAKAKAKKEKAKAKAKKEKQKAKAKKEKAKAKAKKVTCKKSTCSKKNKK